PGYFLIVADFIKWAKDNGIPVGPGRGSGAGSLVAYALLITDLDPIEYELLFERFLNPERVSMPDFDIDFCMENRDRVIEYVSAHYGKEKVSQIITYGTMAAKAVVRDVGRVLGHPYGFTDRLAKMIPFEIGITLDKALEQEETLRQAYEQDEEVANLIDLARSLEGITRNAGKHAGGVVIAPSALTDFSPLYCDETGGNLVTQFDKNDVEDVGLVKFDFLGLRTLTIIDWAVKAVNEQNKGKNLPLLDISKIALDDKKTFDLLKACQTTAVFQLESRGMKDLIKRLQPDLFEDIIALVALFRPGPLQSGMVDDFINRKHGRAKVVYAHPDIGPVLKPTYGVILYQEQVMQIAQVLAGYSLGGADMLRRAMGKKKPEEMAKQREIFTQGAINNNIDEDTATYIFDLMEKFAGYGFNKSHSAAYALVSYQTAWLKAHYPAAFLAAVLSADMDNTDKVVMLIEECEHLKLKVESPNVNASQHSFRAADEVRIFYGLGAIKGVGESAIDVIVNERDRGGKFKDLFDFCQRVDLKKVNRRVLETLVRCGALDDLGPNRASMMASLSTAIKIAEQRSQNSAAGQNDMFGFSDRSSKNDTAAQWTRVPEWKDKRRLQGEKETLGLYLTGHPIDRYRSELKRLNSIPIAKLQPAKRTKVLIAGLLIGMRHMKTKKGDSMAILTLDDCTARIEIAVFSKVLEKTREMLATDKVIIASGEVSLDDYSGRLKMQVADLYDMDSARQQFAKRLIITTEPESRDEKFVENLVNALSPYRADGCPVFVRYVTLQATAGLQLGKEWRIRPTEELLDQLQDIPGNISITLEY
ncbi:MAG TPA: DNA polymerase III subunit alpha, partial [Gammaproteobacteria bacterium]|nr:DNA polymerase III subunit alpha [Gammaproteobacteria bacterium]